MNGDDSHKEFLLKERKDKLLRRLEVLRCAKNKEVAHYLADQEILAYIGDKEVTEAFNKINKY